MEEQGNIHCRIDPELGKNIPFEVKIPNKTTMEAMEEARDRSKLNKAKSVDDLFD